MCHLKKIIFKQYFISILLGNGIGEQAKPILTPFPYMSECHNFTRMDNN